jgi:hypothetical protein
MSMCSRFPCCALPFLYFLCVVVRSRIFARTLTTLVVLLHRWGRTRLAPPSIKVLSPHRILTDTAARTCAVLRRALPPLRFGFWIQHRPLRSCVDPTITAGPQFCGCVSNSSRASQGTQSPPLSLSTSLDYSLLLRSLCMWFARQFFSIAVSHFFYLARGRFSATPPPVPLVCVRTDCTVYRQALLLLSRYVMGPIFPRPCKSVAPSIPPWCLSASNRRV